MMEIMINVLSGIIGFSGGVLVGGALAAFITLIKVIPRLSQVTENEEHLPAFENVFIFGSVLFSVLYFIELYINIGKIINIIIGLIAGTYIGFFSSALAETLNVLPVIAKKFKIKKYFIIIILALLLGKTIGALYYFIIMIGGSNGKFK